MGILVSSLALLLFQFSYQAGPKTNPPDVNLSAIRTIQCSDGSFGTGFVIEDDIVVTARHVTVDSENKPVSCVDGQTKVPLVTYRRDEAHDLALMKPVGPLFIYYPLKYDCQPYRIGPVTLYGHRPESFREHYTSYLGKTGDVEFKNYPKIVQVAYLIGDAASGMSGGPGIQDGYVRGMVTGKQWDRDGNTVRVYSTQLSNTILCKF